MRKFPFVKQLDLKDCGAACLSMIIKYYGGYIPLNKLREMTYTTKKGVTAYHIIEAAKKIGFKSTGYKVDNLNNIKVPCIAHVTIDKSFYHYVVIYEINYELGYLLIADPASRIKKMSFIEFNKIFNNIIILFEKTKVLPIYNNYSYIKFTLNILKKYKTAFIKIVILSLFITLISTITSFYTEKMIKNINNNLLFITFYLFLVLFILKNIIDFIRNNILINLYMKINKSLTNEMFKSIISLPYRYFKNRTSGEIITRLNDLNLVVETIIRVIITIVLDFSLMIFAGIFLIKINYKIFLISLFILLLYIIVLKIFNKHLNTKLINLKEKKELLNSYTLENINAFETIKGLGIEDNVINKYQTINNNFINENYQFEKLYNLENLFNNLINEIGLSLLVFISIILVINNEIVIGNLITSTSLFVLFILPVKNILELNKDIKNSKISYERINEILISEKKYIDFYNLPFKNIKINNLNFSYDEANYNLNNINLNINSKDKIMIVGKSGSGKSTVLKLLKKYYQVDDNMILIDNVDINKLSKKEIDKNIAYVSQNEFLFTDTLYNNLILNRNINKKRIMNVIKNANIDFIDKDLKFNMYIEENGFNLSGGQRKRIILSRTLLNNFNVLILDEIFGEMDIDLERKILKNIFKKYHDKIIIVVSHRKNNLDLFNRFIELEDGKIIKDTTKHLQ